MDQTTTRINLDILSMLMSYMVRRSDLLAVMRICKSAYATGVPALLKGGAAFRSQSKLESFCDFILADAPVRGDHIHELEFCHSLREVRRGSALSGKLVQVLQHATRLEKLTLDCCDNFVGSDPMIFQAFARLASVKDLTIRDADTVLTDLAKRLQSPVEKVKISPDCITESDYDPIPVLSQFQSTLRELSICQWFTESSGEDPNKVLVYPNTRRLDFTFWNHLNMVPMIRAFPNVRYLSLRNVHFEGLMRKDDTLRRTNEAHQAIQWEHLEHIKAGVHSLYLSALKANVGVLDLRASEWSRGLEISAFLRDIRPRRLNLHFDVVYWVDTVGPEVLIPTLDDLTHLSIRFGEQRNGRDSDTIFELIRHTLSSASGLVQLSLEMIAEIECKDGQRFDCKRWAQQCASSIPSLKTVVLVSIEDRTFWDVERVGDENSATLEQLTECEYRQLELNMVSEPKPHWLVDYYKSKY